MSATVCDRMNAPPNECDQSDRELSRQDTERDSGEVADQGPLSLLAQLGEDSGAVEPEGRADWQSEDLETLLATVEEIRRRLDLLNGIIASLQAAREARQSVSPADLS